MWQHNKPKFKPKVSSMPTPRWCLRFDLVEVETRSLFPSYYSFSSLSFLPLFLFFCGKNWSVLFYFWLLWLRCCTRSVSYFHDEWGGSVVAGGKSEFFMLITSVALHSLAIAVIPPFLRMKCPGGGLSIQPRTVQYQVGQTNVLWAGQGKIINDQFIKFTVSMILRHQFIWSTN